MVEAVAVFGLFGFVICGYCIWSQHKRLNAMQARFDAHDRVEAEKRRQRKERAGRSTNGPRLVLHSNE